jgi:hypothetical protein
MDVRPRQTESGRPHSTDLPIARGVIVVLLLLPIAAWFLVGNVIKSAPSPQSVDVSGFNPQTMFSDSTVNFLPTPVAALAPETNAGPPAPAADEQTAADTAVERVKVANTGGAGAILRADPPKGRQVAALRDGTALQVLEHRQLDDGAEWLRVRTPDGVEGWVFSRLVVAADA